MTHTDAFPDLTGAYDNFLQIWKEQTEEDMHKDKRGYNHDHIHLKFERQSTDIYNVSFYRGRNNEEYIQSMLLRFVTTASTEADKGEIAISKAGDSWTSEDGRFTLSDDGTLMSINGLGLFPNQNEEPYRLAKCRYFSGFIEYPLPEDPDTIHRLGNLEIHDQGGMVTLDVPGVDYTVELTQLIFAHKIELMKVAIYDLPLAQVGINSKAISYAWTSPDAKRLGINIRKIISGWTYIEEGFLSSNNMDLKKK